MRFQLLSLCLLALQCEAITRPLNWTIDDTIGDLTTDLRPTYLPPFGVWQDATCSNCAMKPDPSKAFRGTWTAGVYIPGSARMSVQLWFKGTAIYIYFIVANTPTTCNFLLDGQQAGSFNHVPHTSSPSLEYNVLVFSRENLSNIQHTLVFYTSGASQQSYINFDYAIYTFQSEVDTPVSSTTANYSGSQGSGATDQPTSSPNSVTSTGSGGESSTGLSSMAKIMIGGLFGGLAVFTLLALLLLLCRRRRRLAAKSCTTALEKNERSPAPFTEVAPIGESPVKTPTSSSSSLVQKALELVSLSTTTLSTPLLNTDRGKTPMQARGYGMGRSKKVVTQLKEENLALKARITDLQEKMGGNWSASLSVDPPPGYSGPLGGHAAPRSPK